MHDNDYDNNDLEITIAWLFLWNRQANQDKNGQVQKTKHWQNSNLYILATELSPLLQWISCRWRWKHLYSLVSQQQVIYFQNNKINNCLEFRGKHILLFNLIVIFSTGNLINESIGIVKYYIFLTQCLN